MNSLFNLSFSDMEKTLRFSEPFLTAEHVSYTENYQLDRSSIVINIDLDPLEIGEIDLPSMKSIICAKTTIDKVKSMIIISIADEIFLGSNAKIDTEIIKNSWKHVYDLYNLPQLKNIPLWKSEKAKIGNAEFNLWYAPAGTDCGLHKIHDFLEVHTQIYGVGSMQKFHHNNMNSIYQEVYMSPGYSHDPFFTNTGKYPWHQYHAYTDCIWLAIEQH